MIFLWEGCPPAIARSDESRLHNAASFRLQEFEISK